MYQIGICDDEVSTCSELERILLDYFNVSGIEVKVSVWYDAETFIKDVTSKVNLDALFLDIEIPGMNGVQIGEYIRNDMNNEAMNIIYISSKTNYAMDLFKVHPYDFMVKPIDKDKMINAVLKLMELDEHDSRYFVYEYNRVKNKVRYRDIEYFESNRKHIRIVCCDGEVLEFVGKLNEVMEELPNSFARAAQSYVINLRYIKMCKKDSCIMNNGCLINIGRKYKDDFSERLIEYSRYSTIG